jgi:hypothetical protein
MIVFLRVSVCFLIAAVAPVAIAAPSFNSSSNVQCVAGGATNSSTSVISISAHHLIITATHFTKGLPGGQVFNQHNQSSNKSGASSLSQSHTEAEVTGGGLTSNEFNVNANHEYYYCSGTFIAEKQQSSSAKVECDL